MVLCLAIVSLDLMSDSVLSLSLPTNEVGLAEKETIWFLESRLNVYYEFFVCTIIDLVPVHGINALNPLSFNDLVPVGTSYRES